MDTGPADPRSLISQARSFLSAGNPAGAAQLYLKVLQDDPQCFEANYALGTLHARQGRLADAVASMERALDARPTDLIALQAYGSLLMETGRLADAIALFDRALSLRANATPFLFNRALALAMMGRAEEALAGYDQAIAQRPAFLEAWLARGNLLRQLGRFDEALASLNKALACDGNHADAHHALALLLAEMGRPEQALPHIDRVLAQRPQHVPALLDRARILRKLGRFTEALAACDGAIACSRNDAQAWSLRGTLLSDLGRYAEALESYDQALMLDPGMAETLASRGGLRWAQGRQYEAAVADLERAVALGNVYARGELMHIRMYGGDWRHFDQDKAAIDQAVRSGALAIRPFAYQAISESQADLAQCARTFARLYPERPHAPFPPRSHARIRLGYLSADFREHATAYLMAGLFEQHDREVFEIVAIDNGGDDGSALRARLMAAFDRHIPIAGLSDAAAAETIRAAEIDILVNLNGYFGDHRMGVFARRPAPIQVNYLGFPATLGAAYIDYLIADETVIPESDWRFYDEKICWLPGCYQVNDAARLRPDSQPSRAACGLPETGFVFGNFNQTYKLTPVQFAGWMRILRRVPDSALWLLSDLPAFGANIAQAAQRHGIAPERIVVAPRLPVGRHLARLIHADLVLDNLPYNAHTTASDALWMGVPLVTRRGSTFPGRVAASLLQAAGLPELITETEQDYEDLAVALATDPARLAALRERLVPGKMPLFDTAGFCRRIESAYRIMHRTWQAGGAPAAFRVEEP